MLQSKITSMDSVFPFQERRIDEQSGNSEWSKSPPKNSHWGDHFLWIFGDILKHFIAQKGWVESLFFLAVLYKANSWPIPHPVHWITQSHWASCTLWGCRAPGETLSNTWEKAGMVSREYPHLSHPLRSSVLSNAITWGETWCAQAVALPSAAQQTEWSFSMFHFSLSYILLVSQVAPSPCESCGIYQALLPCWVYFGATVGCRGDPTEGGQVTELLFSNQNPSLPSLEQGAGSWSRGGFGPELSLVRRKDLRGRGDPNPSVVSLSLSVMM